MKVHLPFQTLSAAGRAATARGRKSPWRGLALVYSWAELARRERVPKTGGLE